MVITIDAVFWLTMGILLANFPFYSRFFLNAAFLKIKRIAIVVFFEFMICFGIFLMFGKWLESQKNALYEQSWEFYVVQLCLFLIFAFPGFIWRYLRKRALKIGS
jgi:Protein of unknown function (DUF2818)